MNNMKIHQYTNLEALALILKNRTIRFNRLDKVDDLEEGNVESLGVRFSKYIFVSCWTEVEEENIPLWKMYGGDTGGVRISLEQEMFKEYLISDIQIGNLQSQGTILSKIPHQDMINPNFFILPIQDYKNDMFYRHIKYVDDVSYFTKDAIQINNIHEKRGDLHVDTKCFGYYKNNRWKFQDEVRFVLCALPMNPMLEGKNPEISSMVIQSLLENKSLPFDYYDMRLKDDAFEHLEITLSPSATEAQKIIVQALIDKYAPKAKIKDSTLGKLVRLK